jgi:predicted HicB family RNase H-like nuclease
MSTIYVREVTPELLKAAKMTALMKGQSLREFIIAAVTKACSPPPSRTARAEEATHAK